MSLTNSYVFSFQYIVDAFSSNFVVTYKYIHELSRKEFEISRSAVDARTVRTQKRTNINSEVVVYDAVADPGSRAIDNCAAVAVFIECTADRARGSPCTAMENIDRA